MYDTFTPSRLSDLFADLNFAHTVKSKAVMTRKDYLNLAQALHDAKPTYTDYVTQTIAKRVWLTCVGNVAELLRKESRGFNTDQFLDNCGVGK